MTDRTDQTSRFPQTQQSPEHIVLQRSDTATGDLITIQGAGRGNSQILYFRSVPTIMVANPLLGTVYDEDAVIGSISGGS